MNGIEWNLEEKDLRTNIVADTRNSSKKLIIS